MQELTSTYDRNNVFLENIIKCSLDNRVLDTSISDLGDGSGLLKWFLMLQTPLLRVLAALLTSATLSCLESAAEQLVLGLGCGKRGIWLGEWIGLKRCQTWKAGGLSRMNTRDCFSSSAVHNTHANFSRWGLEGESQEDGKRSVGFLWFLWDLCLLITPYEKAGREIPSVVPDTGLLKSAATREENTWEWGIFFFFFNSSFESMWPKTESSGSNTKWLIPMLPKCTFLLMLCTASWLF